MCFFLGGVGENSHARKTQPTRFKRRKRIQGQLFVNWISNLSKLPSRELTYPTWWKGKSSSNMPYQGDMLISWRVCFFLNLNVSVIFGQDSLTITHQFGVTNLRERLLEFAQSNEWSPAKWIQLFEACFKSYVLSMVQSWIECRVNWQLFSRSTTFPNRVCHMPSQIKLPKHGVETIKLSHTYKEEWWVYYETSTNRDIHRKPNLISQTLNVADLCWSTHLQRWVVQGVNVGKHTINGCLGTIDFTWILIC